jgi:hypothetical protein
MKFSAIVAASLFLMGCSKQVIQTDEPQLARSSTQSRAAASTIQFSGRTWNVKSGTSKMGPGPNYWDASSVWVDANGWLHLKIHKNPANGRWYCAEVYSQEVFGNGIYQFWVEGRIDQMDRNIVLGLFNYSGNDGFDEMDIEFATWGRKNANNLNYTVWPATTGFSNFSYSKKITLGSSYTTQRFTRTTNSVSFQTLGGFYNDNSNQIAAATCTSPPSSISTVAMPVHINLWLFSGMKPSNNKDLELVIRQFSFTPLP